MDNVFNFSSFVVYFILSGCVNCLNFNSTGNLLCSGSDDRQIKIWDWQKLKSTQSYSSGKL